MAPIKTGETGVVAQVGGMPQIEFSLDYTDYTGVTGESVINSEIVSSQGKGKEHLSNALWVSEENWIQKSLPCTFIPPSLSDSIGGQNASLSQQCVGKGQEAEEKWKGERDTEREEERSREDGLHLVEPVTL